MAIKRRPSFNPKSFLAKVGEGWSIHAYPEAQRPQINSKALGSQDRTQSRREMEAALVQGCTLTRAKSILSSDRCRNLTSLNDRIAEFIIVDRFPEEGLPVELLSVDHIGTYVVPYPCRRVDDAWRNVEKKTNLHHIGWKGAGRDRDFFFAANDPAIDEESSA